MDEATGLGEGSIIDGRYRLNALIGEGGMGRVYEGEHLDLRRRVAIKVLISEGKLDDKLVQRFEREARALAAVAHRNVVAVTDYGFFEGMPYLVMELLEGRSLSMLLAERDILPIGRAVALLRQVLAGLGHAHAQGLVHRDLKPGNVWIESHADGDLAKLLDFGFVKPISPDSGAMLTADGIVVGTLAYMSPEQAAGGAVDHRSDLYSAGVLLFEMLTGTRPFGGDPIEILRAHITLPPPSLAATRPDLAFSPAIEAVVQRALEKSPMARYESAAELSQALSDAIAGAAPEAESETPTVSLESRRGAAPTEDAKTLIYDDTKTMIDVEAQTLLLDPKTLIRDERKPAGEPSAIELRTQELRALEVAPAEAPAKGRAKEPVAKEPVAKKPPASPGALGGQKLAALFAIAVLGLAAVAIVAHFAAPSRSQEGQGGEPALTSRGGASGPEGRPRTLAHVDVWPLYPASATLERFRRRVDGGAVLSRTEIRELRLYEREHQTDPRVNLVIARAFMNAEWFRDALELFAEAVTKDPRVASNQGFLGELVELSRYKVTSDRASALLVDLYGALALPAIYAEIDRAADDPAGTGRLEALARQIESVALRQRNAPLERPAD
jgi:serine/threonine-protein kinase